MADAPVQKKEESEAAHRVCDRTVDSVARSLRNPKLLVLLLVAVTFFAFWPVSRFDFIGYDDPDYVTANPEVLRGFSGSGIIWAFTTFAAGNWHPLTWLSLMLDVWLIGPDPAALHITNLLLHLANTALLFLLMRRITGAHWRSALVAALFALHPLHVESVAWISERKDVLSTFFFLLTLLAYGAYVRAAASVVTKPDQSDRHKFYFLSLACFAAGLISKPMLVTVPFLLLLLDVWPLQRLDPSFPRRTLMPLVTEKWPFFLLTVLSCGITFAAQKQGGAVRELASLPLASRVENSAVSYLRYLGKTFSWPADLTIFYPHPGTWPLWRVLLATLVLAAITAAVIGLRRNRGYLFTGWLFFLGTMVPVIGLVQVGIQSMADRYTYIPLVGIFIMAAWGIGDLVSMRLLPRPVVISLALLAVIACGVGARYQVNHWRNDETLFGHALKVTPNNALAHNNLADYLFNHHRFQESVDHYHEVVKLNPRYVSAWHNLGLALSFLGRHPEAVESLKKAVDLAPRAVNARISLADAYLAWGKTAEALAEYRTALQLEPDSIPARNNYGFALVRAGEYDRAATVFRGLVASEPQLASAHLGLGTALARKGERAEAEQHLKQALQFEPGSTQAQEELQKLEQAPK